MTTIVVKNDYKGVSMQQILRSKTRVAVLRLFFDNPSREYYLRQIERLTKQPVGNIRRDMLKMESMGLFSRRAMGNLRLYSLNRSYRLYDEYKSLVRKTVGFESGLQKIIARYKSMRFAFIYGSYARGDEKIGSDVDLILIGSCAIKTLKRDMLAYQNRVGLEINSIVYSEDEFMNKVRDKNHFVISLCKSKKIFLKGNQNEFRRFAQIRKG